MASPAPACKKALLDATQKWPNRNRAADGIMGDAAHQARRSDHNEGNAFDLTHDPLNGVDCATLSRDVLQDSRVKYVIYNRQINSLDGKGWRTYNGANPHTKHMHVSIKNDKRSDVSAWPWSSAAGLSDASATGAAAPAARGTNYPGSPVKKGQSGETVGLIQKQLNKQGSMLTVDNHFGDKTYQALKLFQSRNRLTPDGIAGAQTWAALFATGSAGVGAAVPGFTTNLSQGSRGTNVTKVQQQLNTLGVTPRLSTDGVFGAKTRAAVIGFQRKSGITPDGVVGPHTWSRLWRR
ncbi:peptidoglycan-binding domain-containing protein [Enterobacillus tribolii]|uniref:Peptidoglycan hydrolase-like protein with peptidoglycan-binding domain n=1 Tax=Enterobacillus tribolii TaxID=1487935 RepID=A0A370Q755_9GAMM|nr:peptidoglycan-binding protein [Enterobacillus tribolii]MBW7984927.1 peptidoglycan-binding protein [Enterobacillus tribolii]RDK84139.1 peptidoglycan hydrolase-like protein with peptidoglycan-binding domain [Enterobacillus tribolii]